MKKISVVVFLVISLFSCYKPKTSPPQEIKGALGEKAMVATTHPLATAVGLKIMKKGGNAIDAAIAIQFVLSVVYPQAGNIGGGGFAVIRLSDGEVSTLDFREKAPEMAEKDMYLDPEGNVVKAKIRLGHLASGVPGSVAGMWELHQKYGQLSWSELINPAIKLAYNGHLLTEKIAQSLNEQHNNFQEANRYQPWVVNEKGWNKGDTAVQKELASTLSFIQKNGRDGFYKGIVADQLIKEMILGGGIISAKDLINYEPVWRDPIKGFYKGYTIYSMAPPSSGGIALIQLLKGSEYLNIGNLEFNSAEMLHYKTEVERRVYADRAVHLGDPDYYEIPTEALINRNYNNIRFSNIKKRKKTASSKVMEGDVTPYESPETTHFSIVDPEGNAVALTTTLNGSYGSRVMVKGAGFFLNNEMDDFSAKPGVPNIYGLIGSKANAIAPGKRMLSSMTPTIVEKESSLFLVTGSPGGATIITTVFQSIINIIDFGMGLQEAINAKKTHSQWLPDILFIENGGISPEVQLDLEKRGHSIIFKESMSKINAVLVLEDGSLEGGADYLRSDSYAEGF
ncbi:MAG: gamma-glutamyltransferase [Flammeovirgaceae bacterium]|nr:gamma-glutamyltransferase [Flammeovirgaceae bacterium]